MELASYGDGDEEESRRPGGGHGSTGNLQGGAHGGGHGGGHGHGDHGEFEFGEVRLASACPVLDHVYGA